MYGWAREKANPVDTLLVNSIFIRLPEKTLVAGFDPCNTGV
jgi:hypothetical protein